MPGNAERALVIVPTYNEADSIGNVVERLFAATGEDVDLMVVDDNSPDGTAQVVQDLSTADRPIHLIERPGKLGLGSAYVTGFGWGLQRGYASLIEMDADLSHDPADVPRLIDGLHGSELVIGSRYVSGGGTRNWARRREWLSKVANAFARILLGYPVNDSTSGFRAYRADALAKVDLDAVHSEGYAFQIEMTRRIYRSGGRISEVPIIFTERVYGRSKMSRHIVWEAFRNVVKWAVADRLTRRSSHEEIERTR